MAYRDLAEDLIKDHEGLSLRMYKCPAGKNTIGYGHNLDANGISLEVADAILDDDIDQAIEDARALVPNFDEHDDVRRAALVDLSFNMGKGTLSGFDDTLAAFIRKDYAGAALGLEASKWYGQVGNRAREIVAMVRTGMAS